MPARAFLAAALLALAACGVKAPPRPPAGAMRAPAAAADDEIFRVAGTAPGDDCGAEAATAKESDR